MFTRSEADEVRTIIGVLRGTGCCASARRLQQATARLMPKNTARYRTVGYYSDGKYYTEDWTEANQQLSSRIQSLVEDGVSAINISTPYEKEV